MPRVFFWTMGELAKSVKERQLNEFDANMAIDGPRGNGKSTFVYKLFTRIGRFKPKRDILFSRDDVMNALRERKFGLIDADEMINSAHNRDFFSGDQKELIKWMNMYRDNYNVLAGCVPYFYDLDPQVRKLIKMRITIIKRGLGVVQMSKSSLYSNDPWETDVNKKIEMQWTNQLKRGKAMNPQYHKLTTFAGYITFGPLSPQAEKIYKAIKAQKRLELTSEVNGDVKNKEYWVEANELIEASRIKSFQELRYYLLGKGIKYSSGIAMINRHRRDIGIGSSLKQRLKELTTNLSNQESNNLHSNSMETLISN